MLELEIEKTSPHLLNLVKYRDCKGSLINLESSISELMSIFNNDVFINSLLKSDDELSGDLIKTYLDEELYETMSKRSPNINDVVALYNKLYFNFDLCKFTFAYNINSTNHIKLGNNSGLLDIINTDNLVDILKTNNSDIDKVKLILKDVCDNFIDERVEVIYENYLSNSTALLDPLSNIYEDTDDGLHILEYEFVYNIISGSDSILLYGHQEKIEIIIGLFFKFNQNDESDRFLNYRLIDILRNAITQENIMTLIKSNLDSDYMNSITSFVKNKDLKIVFEKEFNVKFPLTLKEIYNLELKNDYLTKKLLTI